MRGRLLGAMLAVVCTTTAFCMGVTPVVAPASSTTAAAATATSTSSGVSPPAFGLGNAQNDNPTTPLTSTPVTTTSSTSGGLSPGDGIVIAVIVVGLLIGIGVFVMRDARSHTINDPDASDDPFASKRKGSKAPPKSRKLKPAERKRRKRSRAPRKRW